MKNNKLSPGNIVELEGSGFLDSFASAHKVFLKAITTNNQSKRSQPNNQKRNSSKKPPTKSGKRKKIKTEVIEVSSSSLKLKVPEDLSLGDYELYIKLKTKFHKSRIQKVSELIQIRPKAASKPELLYDVIDSIEQIDSLISQDTDQRLLLRTTEDLTTGLNQVQAYYIQDGYESIASEPASFFYIPKDQFQKELELKSESPISAFAMHINNESIDVSRITHNESQDLIKDYFLISPSNPKYLLHRKTLKPVFIESLHVRSPEFAVIQNRSSNSFTLKGCYLKDNVKIRQNFEEDLFINAKSSYQVNETLGLNDSSGDSLSLYCPKANQDNPAEDAEFELIDKYSYTELDEDGFAIRE